MDKILLTGATGFLGKIIKNGLSKGHHITTLVRKDEHIIENIVIGDLREGKGLKLESSFDTVIHCAGKAHIVPESDAERSEFYNVNVQGTANLLTTIDKCLEKPIHFVFISTVAVYGVVKGENINEDTLLNAKDPYGHSKILAERIIEKWCKENGIICTILRLPLLVGENPPGNLGNMINAIKKGFYVNIGGGKAKKSMVLAEDVARFIPQVATIGGIYNLTDGVHPDFLNLSTYIARQLKKRQPLNIPQNIVFLMAKFGDFFGKYSPINTNKFLKIISNLTFDDSKARKIGWNPKEVIGNFKLE